VIGTVADFSFPIVDASFGVFGSTFDLAGVGSQSVSFFV
jgi:hypothetical protein